MGTFLSCPLSMRARQVVLLAPPKSSHLRPLLSRQHLVPVSPLTATLTKNRGGVQMRCSHRERNFGTISSPLSPVPLPTDHCPLITGHFPLSPVFAVRRGGPLIRKHGRSTNSSHFGTRCSILLTCRPSCSRIVRAPGVLRMGDLGPATSRRNS